MNRTTILRPGDTCWRVESAERVQVIVDGADYFAMLKRALLTAEDAVFMIGWDFDGRVDLEPEGTTLPGPNELAKFLFWLAEERPSLDIYILQWAFGQTEALSRGEIPLGIRAITAPANVMASLDSTHPMGAAHHSKVIVVDDALAFCGGIDITAGRWDTRKHADADPRRDIPGAPGQPWHDVTTALNGPVAAALGELARERWRLATGDTLPAPAPRAPLWLDDLPTTFANVEVGIARTAPTLGERPEVREIEALYLAIVEATQATLYIETQYLGSRTVAEAMAARLAEPDGPEIVLILPQQADGWLRRKAMDGARQRLLRYLWANDRHRRFAAYYPVTAEGGPIYVHSKVLVMDDTLLRVGSSNLNNRSMGFDTETDVVIDAASCAEAGTLRDTIATFRNDLIAEHLGVTDERVRAAVAQEGSLIAAIEHLSGDGRTLCRFTREDVEDEDSIFAENEFADPESAEEGLGRRLSTGFAQLIENLTGD